MNEPEHILILRPQQFPSSRRGSRGILAPPSGQLLLYFEIKCIFLNKPNELWAVNGVQGYSILVAKQM